MEKLFKLLGFSKCQICGKPVENPLGMFLKICYGGICENCGWEQISEGELMHPDSELGQNGGYSYNEYKLMWNDKQKQTY